MELSPLPARPAPNFTFVDQKGTTISLTSLRGHPVVLNFMDSHCTDICPIVSAELVMADRQLARYAKDTVFLAVNVNQYNTSVASVEAFSANHGLNSIPTWHFLTGPVPALEATWRAYGIAVHAPSPTADVVHTSATYFIDPKGNERYIAAPAVNHTKKGKAYLPPVDISAWARGIAEVANSLAK